MNILCHLSKTRSDMAYPGMHLDLGGSKVLVCGSTVRIVALGYDPWFCGKELAMALGHKNPQQAFRVHVDPAGLS